MLMAFLVIQMFRKWRMIYGFGTGIYNLQFQVFSKISHKWVIEDIYCVTDLSLSNLAAGCV